MVVCPSICFRMDSTAACERRKRFASALSSRSRPRRRCSVSMYGLPNWLASYRAKKITLRAFSVYRSNIDCKSPLDLKILRRAPGMRTKWLSRYQPAFFHTQYAVAAPRERQVVRNQDRGEAMRAVQTRQEFEDHQI